MNTSIMKMRALATAIAALAILSPLAGCGRGAEQPAPPLAGAALGGPFILIDQDGRAVTDRDYAGRYRAVYFGYTFCPDVCPTTLAKLMAGVHAFAATSPALAAKVAPIFITVDPDRDTPAVLKQYVAAFGPELTGLTGTPAQIAGVAKDYGVYFHKQPVAKGASGYLMDHSSQAILFGPDGKPIALLPADESGDAVAAELGRWVR
ncbi:MAG TPA: SCO family protein [Sphingomonas sp.]